MVDFALRAAPTPSVPGTPPARSGPGVTTAAVVLLAIAALYFGQDIFVPFALAVLLSFLLAPPVARLRRLRVPRVPAVVLVVALAFTLIGALSMLVGSQVVQLAKNLPSYQYTMQEKIRGIRASAQGGGVFERATEAIDAVKRELSEEAAEEKKKTAARPAETAEKEPLPVRIEPPSPQPLDVVRTLLDPLLGPVGTAGIVIVFVVFILLERDDIRDRFIRLAGGELHRTTEALNEAATRVSRYLLMQLIVNATYGIPIGVGLYFIGVPNAFLWGLLAMLLRFVPYLGPFIAAFFPLALAFAVDPGWTMMLWSAALFLGVELLSNNVIEPWLYGTTTGLSPVAIILAAIFWTTLWGPIGLILATPLTVCLVVMGRYVPQLEFFGVLLGNEPVLTPEERFYQRLLAGNAEEAIEIAEAHIEEHSLASFYDDVGLPALRLAENDRRHGITEREHRLRVADGAHAVVRELRELAEKNGIEECKETPQPRWPGLPALCIAGRSALDEAAAAMLAHMLECEGIGARHLPASAITPQDIGSLDLAGAEVVCLSYLEPTPQAYARFVCRRLKRRAPQVKVVLGLWNLAPEAGATDRIAAAAGAEASAATLIDAVRRVEGMASQEASASMTPPELPGQEQERLEALYSCGVLDARNGERMNRLARGVAEAFEVPIALVSLVDESCQLWVGAAGLPTALDEARRAPRETSICGHVVAADAPLVIEDTAVDPRFAGNPFLREHGIRFYAGAPLRTASGHVIGSLCIIDIRPRKLGPREVKLLQVIADQLMAEFGEPSDGDADRGGDEPERAEPIPIELPRA